MDGYNPLKIVELVVEELSKAEKDLVYLGSEPMGVGSEDLGTRIELAEDLGRSAVEYTLGEALEPPYGGFVDSSSRSISYPGVRVFIGSCYARDGARHILIPQGPGPPFLAIQAGRRAIEELRRRVAGLAYVESPSGEPYDEGYKADNIHDELRLRLENAVLGSMASPRILIDGPIYPVQLAMARAFGEEYYRAFERLYRERLPHIGRLIGVVKRLDQTYKLIRVGEVYEAYTRSGGKGVKAPDPVVMSRIAGGRRIYILGILREEFAGLGQRYMVYTYVRTPSGPRVFRLEALEKDIVIRAAGYCIKNLSISGLPIDIEVADRISKKLSASIYVALYTMGSPKLGLTHDESVKISQVLGELRG